jgi:hypothetical protein
MIAGNESSKRTTDCMKPSGITAMRANKQNMRGTNYAKRAAIAGSMGTGGGTWKEAGGIGTATGMITTTTTIATMIIANI